MGEGVWLEAINWCCCLMLEYGTLSRASNWMEQSHALRAFILPHLRPSLPPRAASLFWGPLHSNGVLRPDAGCHLLAKSSLWWFLFLFPGGCSHRRTNLGCSLLCVVLTPTASSKAFFLTVTCLRFCFQIRSQLYHYLSCSQIDFFVPTTEQLFILSKRTTRHIAVFDVEDFIVLKDYPWVGCGVRAVPLEFVLRYQDKLPVISTWIFYSTTRYK